MRHKVRFRFDSLSQYSVGAREPIRIPVKCWRFTAQLSPNLSAPYTVDGVDFTSDFIADIGASSLIVNTVTIRVGGVFDAHGNPVLIDQDFIVNTNNGQAYGLLIFEDIITA